MEGLEQKVERMEAAGENQICGEARWEKRGKVERVAERLREMEIKWDKEKRKERRNNIVIKGIKLEDRKIEEAVDELWIVMSIKENVKEIRKIGGVDREGRGLVLVKLEAFEDKKRVMKVKKRLRGRRERIENDLTREERRTRWKIEREAEREREKGKRVQVGYMKMWVDGVMKRWNEVEEVWAEGKRVLRCKDGGRRD